MTTCPTCRRPVAGPRSTWEPRAVQPECFSASAWHRRFEGGAEREESRDDCKRAAKVAKREQP